MPGSHLVRLCHFNCFDAYGPFQIIYLPFMSCCMFVFASHLQCCEITKAHNLKTSYLFTSLQVMNLRKVKKKMR